MVPLEAAIIMWWISFIVSLLIINHLNPHAETVVFVCHYVVVEKLASLVSLFRLYTGRQPWRMRVLRSSVADRVNIQSSRWCPLLRSFSQDDSHPLQHSWDRLHCPPFPLPASVMSSQRAQMHENTHTHIHTQTHSLPSRISHNPSYLFVS